MPKHYQFDMGTIEVKVGEKFEITGRFASITDKRKIAFPEDAFRLVSEREGKEGELSKEKRKRYDAPPVVIGTFIPKVYTLEALTEGTYEVEYLYFGAPQHIHNADKYTVNVTN